MDKVSVLVRAFLETDYKQHIKRFFVWAAVSLFAFAFIFIFGQIYDRPREGEVFEPQLSGLTEPLLEGDVLSQEITFPFERVRSLWVNFDASQATAPVMYLVTLYDENGKVVMQSDFKTSEAASFVNVLPTPLSGIANKIYRLEIQVARTTLNSAAAFATMESSNFAPPATLNGNTLQAPLAIRLNMATKGTATWVIVLVLLCILFAGVLLLMGKNHVWNTVLMILAFGAFICVLNPIGDVPDEYAHFLRAESLSKGVVFGTATTEISSDAQLRELLLMGNQNSNTFARFSDAALYGLKAGGEATAVPIGTAGNYLFLGYIASALGVGIGKLFNMSAMICIYLSRFLNVVYYAALCGLAVAIAPRFKKIFSFVACLPMCLFLAASFNPDGITISLVLLSAALLLWIHQKNEGTVELWHTGLWLGLTLCASLTRISYVVLLFLVFLIPQKAYRKPKSVRWVILQLGIALGAAGLWAYFSGLQGLRTISGADAGGQVAFILQNIPMGIRIILGTIIEEIYVVLQGVFLLGWQTYNINWIGVILPFMFLHLAESEKPLAMPIKNSGRTCVIMMAAIYLITYLGMYVTSNTVGSSVVLGVQGRYFIELFALLPLCLSRFAKDKKQWQYTSYAYSSFLFAALSSAMILKHYM